MFSIGDIGRYFHCLCVAVVVAITAANAVLVGVKSSYFFVQSSSCAYVCSIFVWDQLMWCLGLMSMTSGWFKENLFLK